MSQTPRFDARVAVETRGNPGTENVWLHGIGADGSDFAPIVPEVDAPDLEGIRFVFPHAPVRPVTINGGMRMRAWYDIAALNIKRTQDEVGIMESRAVVAYHLQRHDASRNRSERIFLAGFSKGRARDLTIVLYHGRQLVGRVVLSAYLPFPARIDGQRTFSTLGAPIFLGHGTQDPIAPLALGRITHTWLQGRSYPVEWRQCPMPHSVRAWEVAQLRIWLRRQVA